MKRNFILSVVALMMVVLSGCTDAKPKYVFYFIGDGMGLNIVHAAEYYKAAEKGIKLKADTINFAHFPIIGFANSSSADSYITDSAAAGTALACGQKTKQGTIGMDTTQQVPLKSIAIRAKEQGMGVGVVTSVSIDHATPASFYGHNASRNGYYDIAMEGAVSNIDLFGGSGFLNPTKEGSDKEVYAAYAENGYTLFPGKSSLGSIDTCLTKVLITEREGADNSSFAYAIDRKDDDLSLVDLVTKATEYLYKKYESEGFMLVAEGGKVDWGAHANDIKASIGEVIDLDAAVAVAYQFYLQHPDETLIVVTADHETGGYANANGGGYSLNFDKILCKVPSREVYGAQIRAAVASGAAFEQLPMPGDYKFSSNEKAVLRDLYIKLTDSAVASDESSQKSMYEKAQNSFAVAAYDLINRGVNAGWTTGGHSGSPVMIYSIGAGAEKMGGHKDNTEIPTTIATLMGLK
ncbi:MAG: alkaline phosphatase [Rikenellaceae bacterium]